METDRGLVLIYTGKGKGKTTAALGIVLRAVGHGLKVLMIQFIKGEWYYGELSSSKRLTPEFEMIAAGKGFIGILDDDHDFGEHKKSAKDAINLKLVSTEEVLELINVRPKDTSIVLTGNYAPHEIIKVADLVTEMNEIKHPYKSGIKAKRGIDY